MSEGPYLAAPTAEEKCQHALSVVIEALIPLKRSERARILQTVATFFAEEPASMGFSFGTGTGESGETAEE